MKLGTRGFTLFEVLTAIVIVGIVLAFAAPKISQIGNGTNLRGARGAMLTALNVAKSSAVTSGKCAYLKIDGNAVTVFLTACAGGGQTVVISNRNFANDYGVAVVLAKGNTLPAVGTGSGTDSIGFDPRGIPVNSQQQALFTFTRHSETRTVSVGNYGRLQ